jgi:hypothetical protein
MSELIQCLCCPVEVAALRLADHRYKESYLLSHKMKDAKLERRFTYAL